jgi:hypothetical protein
MGWKYWTYYKTIILEKKEDTPRILFLLLHFHHCELETKFFIHYYRFYPPLTRWGEGGGEGKISNMFGYRYEKRDRYTR